VAGDEAAMDALIGEARTVAGDRDPVVVIVPTAAARQRPDQAVEYGERAFQAAAARAGIAVRLTTARILTRDDAADPSLIEPIGIADLVHFPGGDPDLIPAVHRDTPAWTAILAALERGACVAGASAGAMALGGRVWTSRGGIDGLGLLPGTAVIPHFAPDRVTSWRRIVEDGAALTWIGLDEQTLVLGRPGGTWTVAGRGRVHLVPAGALEPTLVAHHGMAVSLG
jgi:cyanophycinase